MLYFGFGLCIVTRWLERSSFSGVHVLYSDCLRLFSVYEVVIDLRRCLSSMWMPAGEKGGCGGVWDNLIESAVCLCFSACAALVDTARLDGLCWPPEEETLPPNDTDAASLRLSDKLLLLSGLIIDKLLISVICSHPCPIVVYFLFSTELFKYASRRGQFSDWSLYWLFVFFCFRCKSND